MLPMDLLFRASSQIELIRYLVFEGGYSINHFLHEGNIDADGWQNTDVVLTVIFYVTLLL